MFSSYLLLTENPCKESEAPINITTTDVSWTRTLVTLRGIITCKSKYLYNGNSPEIYCDSSGWTPPDGICVSSRIDAADMVRV